MRLILLLALIGAAYFFFRQLRRAPAEQQRRLLWRGGVTVAVVVALLLVVTGRLPWVAAVAAALLPLLKPALRLVLPGLLAQLARKGQRQGGDSDQRRGGHTDEQRRQRPPSSHMSHSEALAALGLSDGATREEIIGAHRRLIQRVHPDRGGSDYLAARINLAKETLLEELG